MVESKTCPLVDVVPVKKDKYVDVSFSFASVYSILFLIFILVSRVWLVVATMNGRVCVFEGMINLINDVVSFFIIVMMSWVLIIQAGLMDNIIQVRKKYPHFIYE
jgi:hypothetical protein